MPSFIQMDIDYNVTATMTTIDTIFVNISIEAKP